MLSLSIASNRNIQNKGCRKFNFKGGFSKNIYQFVAVCLYHVQLYAGDTQTQKQMTLLHRRDSRWVLNLNLAGLQSKIVKMCFYDKSDSDISLQIRWVKEVRGIGLR